MSSISKDSLDPTVQQLLFDVHRVSDALRILKQKCSDGLNSSSRNLGTALGGLDSYSLREILDRLFGESDGGTSLSNWVDACDHCSFKLFNSMRGNIIEVRISGGMFGSAGRADPDDNPAHSPAYLSILFHFTTLAHPFAPSTRPHTTDSMLSFSRLAFLTCPPFLLDGCQVESRGAGALRGCI